MVSPCHTVQIKLHPHNHSPPSGSGTDPESGQANPFLQAIIAFDVLSILAGVGLSIVLITALFSSRVRRLSTWYMVVGSMLIVSITNSLLLGQQTGPPPNEGVCLFQAMLSYAYPVLVACSGASFMLQVYLSLSSALNSSSTVFSKTTERLLHGIPCALFAGVLIEILIFGLFDRSLVQREFSGAYCHITPTTPALITAGLTVGGILVFFVFQVLTIAMLRRVWKASGKYAAFHPSEHVSINVVIRISVLFICAIAAVMTSLLNYVPGIAHRIPKLETISLLWRALVPFCAIFIFGAQEDIVSVWMFWRPQNC